MSYHHRLLASAYYPLKLAKAICLPLGLVAQDSLRVLVYHDVAVYDQGNLAAQLRWLKQSWNFVSADGFGAMVSGRRPIRGRNLLLTFDDGFASNRVVAEEVLNPLRIPALFFAVSDFVALEDRDEARKFVARHIQPGTHPDQLPAHLYNMGWADLEALLEQGHSIGAHTKTHARLSQIPSEPDLEREIISSADILEHRLGIPIVHFAYTFGDLPSFSRSALAVARRRFSFIYSGLRGDNAMGVSTLALNRDAVTPHDSFALVGAFLEGAADFRYARSRKALRTWI